MGKSKAEVKKAETLSETTVAMPTVVIQTAPAGLRVGWLDCDVHAAINMLTAARESLLAQHYAAHEKEREDAAKK